MRLWTTLLLLVFPLSLFAALRGAYLSKGSSGILVRITVCYLCYDFIANERLGGSAHFYNGHAPLIVLLLLILSKLTPIHFCGGAPTLAALRIAARGLLDATSPTRLVHAGAGIWLFRSDFPEAHSTAILALVGVLLFGEGISPATLLCAICAAAPAFTHLSLSGSKTYPIDIIGSTVSADDEEELFREIKNLPSTLDD